MLHLNLENGKSLTSYLQPHKSYLNSILRKYIFKSHIKNFYLEYIENLYYLIMKSQITQIKIGKII